MIEVSRREKEAGIVPDPDIDTYMKVTIKFNYIAYDKFKILLEIHIFNTCRQSQLKDKRKISKLTTF